MSTPTPSNIIALTIADLVLYCITFPMTIYITWKHGKTGMICWPIFLSFFGLRFAADIYQIINRSKPQQYNEVVIMTNSGSIACLSLTIIGLVFEANMLLPLPPRSLKEKIILGVTHLANTGGIAVATYGGAPSATAASGVMNDDLNKIGNCLMLFVMFTVCWWIWPTYKRLKTVPVHPNFWSAKVLLFTAAGALPFQLVRLSYSTIYALNRVASLDPVVGAFAPRLLLMFLPQLGVVLVAVTGGLMARNIVPRSQLAGDDLILKEMPSGRSSIRTAENSGPESGPRQNDNSVVSPEQSAPREQSPSRELQARREARREAREKKLRETSREVRQESYRQSHDEPEGSRV